MNRDTNSVLPMRSVRGGFVPLLLVFVLVIIPVVVDGQSYHGSKIKLQTGEVIRGRLSDCNENDTLHLRLPNGRQREFHQREVRKITFKRIRVRPSTFDDTGYNPLGKGRFFHGVQAGLLLGDEHANAALHAVNGYMFHQYFGTAIGIGLDHYDDYTIMPVYAQLRGYLRQHRSAPFYYANAGYGFAWHDNPEGAEVNGGLYWEAGMGYQIHFKPLSLQFVAGYRNVTAGRTFETPEETAWSSFYPYSPMEISEKTIFRRIFMGIGVQF